MSDTAAKPPMTAADVREGLRKHFGVDGAILLDEVGNGTGHRRTPRWVDMMVMETWPSRGFMVHGIEIKISRQDWLRELKSPAKAEALHEHCDHWWVATANKGVIASTDELPAGWGWIEIRPERVVRVVQAPRQERPPHLPRSIVAAMLRALTRDMAATIDAKVRDARDSIEANLREMMERDRADARDKGAELLRKMTVAMGPEAMRWMEADRAIAAWRLVHNLNLAQSYSPLSELLDGIDRLLDAAGKMKERLAAEMRATGLEPPPDPKRRRVGFL